MRNRVLLALECMLLVFIARFEILKAVSQIVTIVAPVDGEAWNASTTITLATNLLKANAFARRISASLGDYILCIGGDVIIGAGIEGATTCNELESATTLTTTDIRVLPPTKGISVIRAWIQHRKYAPARALASPASARTLAAIWLEPTGAVEALKLMLASTVVKSEQAAIYHYLAVAHQQVRTNKSFLLCTQRTCLCVILRSSQMVRRVHL